MSRLLLVVLAFSGLASLAVGEGPKLDRSSGDRLQNVQSGENWIPNSHYAKGDCVTYNGESYVALQAHKSQVDWDPTVAISLWKLAPNCGTGPDTQPPETSSAPVTYAPPTYDAPTTYAPTQPPETYPPAPETSSAPVTYAPSTYAPTQPPETYPPAPETYAPVTDPYGKGGHGWGDDGYNGWEGGKGKGKGKDDKKKSKKKGKDGDGSSWGGDGKGKGKDDGKGKGGKDDGKGKGKGGSGGSWGGGSWGGKGRKLFRVGRYRLQNVAHGAEWILNSNYAKGDCVTYNGNFYVALQAHKSQVDWDPIVAISLWKLSSNCEGTGPDTQPPETYAPATDAPTTSAPYPHDPGYNGWEGGKGKGKEKSKKKGGW